MKKQVTYEDYSGNSGELELSLSEMLNLFDRINWIDGAFMYFPIDETYIFQMMGAKDGSIMAEFTDTTDATPYQKRVSKEECREMIKAFFGKISMEPAMMDDFETSQTKHLYDSVKDSLWKKIIFWIIFIGFFVGLAVLGAYIIYW